MFIERLLGGLKYTHAKSVLQPPGERNATEPSQLSLALSGGEIPKPQAERRSRAVAAAVLGSLKPLRLAYNSIGLAIFLHLAYSSKPPERKPSGAAAHLSSKIKE
jgi:hypothetical protein